MQTSRENVFHIVEVPPPTGVTGRSRMGEETESEGVVEGRDFDFGAVGDSEGRVITGRTNLKAVKLLCSSTSDSDSEESEESSDTAAAFDPVLDLALRDAFTIHLSG